MSNCASEATDHHHHHGDDHGHDHGDGHSHDDDLTPALQSSLYQYVDFDAIRTLNEEEEGQGKSIVKKTWEDRRNDEPELRSDTDQEILMYIPFTGLVRLHSILIRSPPDHSAPSTLKIFINRDDLDFSTASDLTATQILTLPIVPASGSTDDTVEVPVKRALFNNVTSLSLFFEENHSQGEEDVTCINYLGFKGDFTKLGKEPISVLYEAAANPKDHKNIVPGAKMMDYGNQY